MKMKPYIQNVPKFIHFTGIDSTVLLSSGKTNNPQTFESDRCNTGIVSGQILFW